MEACEVPPRLRPEPRDPTQLNRFQWEREAGRTILKIQRVKTTMPGRSFVRSEIPKNRGHRSVERTVTCHVMTGVRPGRRLARRLRRRVSIAEAQTQTGPVRLLRPALRTGWARGRTGQHARRTRRTRRTRPLAATRLL